MDVESWLCQGVQNELEAEGELQIVWFTCGSLLRSRCSVDVDVLIFCKRTTSGSLCRTLEIWKDFLMKEIHGFQKKMLDNELSTGGSLWVNALRSQDLPELFGKFMARTVSLCHTSVRLFWIWRHLCLLCWFQRVTKCVDHFNVHFMLGFFNSAPIWSMPKCHTQGCQVASDPAKWPWHETSHQNAFRRHLPQILQKSTCPESSKWTILEFSGVLAHVFSWCFDTVDFLVPRDSRALLLKL